MIQHEDRQLNTMPFRPLGLTRRVLRNFYNNECEVYVTYGMPEGIGKSAHTNLSLADIYGYMSEHDSEKVRYMKVKNNERPRDTEIWKLDWERAKEFIHYQPEDIVRLCREMLVKGRREPLLHWDDGGTWLNAMEYTDPFVIAFMEYLPLARSNWGGIDISTPVEEWVLKKLRTARGVVHIEIIKTGGDLNVWKPRRATGYKIERYIGGRKIYYPRQWIDNYPGIMDDGFYHWYKPRRDQYTLIATLRMEKALAKRKEKGFNVAFDENVLDEARRQIEHANDLSQDFREVIAQATPGER